MPDYFETGFAVRQPSWHAKEDLVGEVRVSIADARAIERWHAATVELVSRLRGA